MEYPNNQPLVSIVMPAYNCERYIQKAIGSILSQTYQRIELLIADDGSKDSTKQILASYADPRIQLYNNEKNLGYLKTCNKLLKLTKGDLITFQDADDYSEHNRIELLVNAFEKDKNLACCGSNCHVIDTENKVTSTSSFELSYEKIKEAFPQQNTFIGACLMVKREVLETIGVYNEYFNRIGSEDIYWFALILEKYKTINLPEALYYYRSNPLSVSHTHKDIKGTFSGDIVKFLIKQRRANGTDGLTNKKQLKELDRFVKQREIKQLFWNHQIGKGLAKSLTLILQNPFQGKLFYKDLVIYSFVIFKRKNKP